MRPHRCLLALPGSLLAACGQPAYYLLPPPQPRAARAARRSARVVVADISLPAYAERARDRRR